MAANYCFLYFHSSSNSVGFFCNRDSEKNRTSVSHVGYISQFKLCFHISYFSLHKKTDTLSHHLCCVEQCCSYFPIMGFPFTKNFPIMCNIQAATARADNSVLLSYCLRLHSRPARPVLLIDSRVNPTCGDPTAEKQAAAAGNHW